ncbi:MAG: UDP-N-acetylglucosamine 1-carboxyvinyltransferase, partial [Spirochaetales bacterium]|nr:UDP-N-acetylglucosamine 1-carboxyvinyltransferase [Spirochaetales bacterium]
MSYYSINGGLSLSGQVRISGNKNAALPCIVATLLTDEACLLKNIPYIQDVKVMFKILSDIGSTVSFLGDGQYAVHSNIKAIEFNSSLIDSVRGSILFAGPLLARGYSIELPPPGGDVIGLRRLDSHFLGFTALGVSCEVMNNGYLKMVPPKRLIGTTIILDEASVTATENIVMAAVLAEGKTTLYNAACEPHIQSLCNMLNKMGAKISGIGSNFITIEGVESLKGVTHELTFDYMEAGSYIGLAACTNSELTLTNIDISNMFPLQRGFKKLGITFELKQDSIYIPKEQTKIINKTYLGVIDKLDDGPWPCFPADLLSIMVVVATQMKGQLLIHEKMFESRMYFIDNLIKMGADIILCDPHRALINGPKALHSASVVSPDIRAGMSLVIAALATNGTTVISNIEQVERGYDCIFDKLLKIGADI